MPLHPKAKELLEQFAASGIPPLGTLPVAETRALYDSGNVALTGPPEPLAEVDDRRIPGPAGEIPIRIYAPQATGPLPSTIGSRRRASSQPRPRTAMPPRAGSPSRPPRSAAIRGVWRSAVTARAETSRPW